MTRASHPSGTGRSQLGRTPSCPNVPALARPTKHARTRRLHAARSLTLAFFTLLIPVFLAACQQTPLDDLDPPPPIQRGSPPAFADAAERFNQRVASLGNISATGIIEVRTRTTDGSLATEQGDAVLHVRLPDRCALIVRKLGITLFLLGSNDRRAWWIDRSGSERTAVIGSPETFTRVQSERIGLGIPPSRIPAALGLEPLNPRQPGATQWSANTRLLGLTTALADGGRRRLWLDAETYTPVQVELYDAALRTVLVSRLLEPRPAEIRGFVVGPTAPTRFIIAHPPTGTEIRFVVDRAWSDRQASDEPFNLDALLQPSDRVIDLDAPSPPRAGEGPRLNQISRTRD